MVTTSQVFIDHARLECRHDEADRYRYLLDIGREGHSLRRTNLSINSLAAL